MAKLIEIADVIRSKNSGPYELTFDIIFKEQATFEKLKQSGKPTKADFAELYQTDENKVLDIIWFDPAKALKITMIRPFASGALGETDVYGAQQHAPLLNWEFEI